MFRNRSTYTRKPKPQRHRWVDDGLTASGPGMRRLVDRTLAFLSHNETHCKARVRARRAADLALHIRRVETVIVNLALAVLDPPESGKLAISTRNRARGRTRYESAAMGGKPLRDLLSTIDDVGVLEVRAPSVRRGEASSIRPTAWFASQVAQSGATLEEIGRDPNDELILLTRNDHEFGSDGERTTTRERIDYADTPVTTSYRAALRRLNEHLSSADIAFVDDGLQPAVNARERTLRRHFVHLEGQPTANFEAGGRLYGGFWENLPRSRRRYLRINGEHVATLDYSSMFTRLAYAQLGLPPPAGDLYAIAGLDGYRSGIKMAMNCLLFDTRRRRTWPRQLGLGVGDDAEVAANSGSQAAAYKARLPAGYGVKKLKKAILKKHPALSAAWGRGLGYKLMFIESQVLVAVLEELMSKGVVALGLHDGLLVAHSQADVAREAMDRAAVKVAGIDLPVVIKDEGLSAIAAGIDRGSTPTSPHTSSCSHHSLLPSMRPVRIDDLQPEAST